MLHAAVRSFRDEAPELRPWSLVAGVIGRRKFAYDLWGDTVNTASRLESHGSPDRIQVTESIYECLRDLYTFSDMHVVDLKGKGPTPTRLLLGREGEPR